MSDLNKGLKLLGNAIAVVLVSAVVFSAYHVFYKSHARVHDQILWIHNDPNQMPRDKGQMPFLYVSWFYPKSFYGGKDYALYSNGVGRVRRITSGGIQGESGNVPDVQTWPVLKQLSSLPSGLSSPDAVPANRLLIVSLRHGNHWETYYYDRQSLPPQVQPIARVAGVWGV
jgi:hypothetical protein